ncbi:MAG: outer membrane protein assembly factor BamA [Pseudomonadota bacterium]|nr:outer membrane protein assembly factor BamA [Pseudomonadota bacterium]
MRSSARPAQGPVAAVLLVLLGVFTCVVGSALPASLAHAQTGFTISSIQVQGNRRVEPETVRSYLTFRAGSKYDPLEVDESLKVLFATGLFQDVRIGNRGTVVIVIVVENPIINRVAFEGNKEIEDDSLKSEVQLKPRAVFTRAKVQSDLQRILDVYRRQGRFSARVEPKIINLDHNRVDLVFEIQEGPKTTVKGISFIGNQAFSDSQLREVITTTETGLLSFFKPTNIYDPDRLNLDRELLRQHYLKNGYADASIVSAVADLDREGQGFLITFTISEGEQYRFGAIDIESGLAQINPQEALSKAETRTGKIYDASKVDKSVENITMDVSRQGYAFGRVRTRLDRDPSTRKIGLTYVIEEGPRIYIERIEILGNNRTLDYVIRREFRLAEGDAYNRLLVDAAKRRLKAMGFFKNVDVNAEQGSAPDRVIIVVKVQEQATGEFSVGGGYSSNEGALADISLSERNFLGKGQFIRARVQGSQERLQFDFSFTEPRFMGRQMAAGFDAFHTELDSTSQSSFKSRRSGASIRFGIPLANDWSLATRYTISQESIFDIQADASQAVKDAEGDTLVSSVGYTIAHDTRNNKKNPTQGHYLAVNQDLAGLGGDVNYIRTTAEARAYYPVYKKIILVGRLAGGHVEGLGEDVRILDTFFIGGETIRGFDRAGIGPRDLSTGDALGAKIYGVATAELRFPIPLVPENLGLSAAVFADVGTAFEPGNLGSINPAVVGDENTLRSAVGFSLIWDSPLGPLRADISTVLNSAAFDDEENFRFGAATRF